jgi:thioredoxin reductase
MNEPATEVHGTDVDVAVVGAGPAGLAAALVLGRAARSTVLVDAGPGRNQPAAAVHGYLGHDGTTPAELHAIARAQVAAYPAVTTVEARVTAITGQDGAFVVRLEDGTGYQSRRVVLATGVTDDLPAIDGLAALWGRTVVHCPYCHGWELRGQPTAVLVHQPLDLLLALKVTHLTEDVAVCLNGGPALNADEAAMLAAAGIAVWPQPIRRLDAEGDQLRSIVFGDGTSLERSAFYVHPAVRQVAPFAADLCCRLLDNGLIEVDDLGHTSVAGVHAIGDIAQRPTMPLPGQQVAIAAAEGATTAIAIDQELLFADHLTPPVGDPNRD